ncbi:MAG TPA: NosD domain-containing protein [Thermoplasmata archaeon]|nr:NosD domain-containing protein [Thermoplasmata archaeon]
MGGLESRRDVLRMCLIAGSLLATGFVLQTFSTANAQAALIPHQPISIYGDDQFTPAHGVVTGNGTVTDPFVIQGWDIDASSATGIYVQDTQAVFVIRNCHIHGNAAISFWNVVHGNVENNSIDVSGRAIEFGESDGLLVSNNDFSGPGSGVATFSSRHVTLFANRFAAGGVFVSGAFVDQYDSLQVPANNTINGRPIMLVKDSAGAEIDGGDIGQLLLVNVSGARIANLTVGGAYANMLLAFVNDTTLLRNVVANGTYGIYVDKSSDVWITDNNVSSNVDTGIGIYYSSTATIVGNNIASNQYGIRMEFGSSASIFHNNLVRNGVQAVVDVDSGGKWNDVYPSGGNFWSDYSGLDSCSGNDQNVCPNPDGIGDTPRAISDLRADRDRFPLMSPFSGTSPRQPSPYPLYGSVSEGWGSTPTSLTSPGPVFATREGETITLHLLSVDGLTHSWFLDINNNSIPDSGEPVSPDFQSGTVPLNFTFNAPPGMVGAFPYRCRYHPAVMNGQFVIRPNRSEPSFSLYGNFNGWGLSMNSTSNPGPTLELYYGEVATLQLTTLDYTHFFTWFIDYNNDTVEQAWEPSSGAFWYHSPIQTRFTANRLGTFTYRSSEYPTIMTGLVQVTGTQIKQSAPPSTEASLAGKRGSNDWFVSAVTVSLTASDLLGSVTRTQFRIDLGVWSNYTAPFTIATDGFHVMSFYSTNDAGDVEAVKSAIVRIDTVPPGIRIFDSAESTVSSPLTVDWQVQDASSGLGYCVIQMDQDDPTNVGTTSSATFNLADGVHTFSVVAFDSAGNSASATARFVVGGSAAQSPLGFPSNYVSGGAIAGVAGGLALLSAWWIRRHRRPPRR